MGLGLLLACILMYTDYIVILFQIAQEIMTMNTLKPSNNLPAYPWNDLGKDVHMHVDREQDTISCQGAYPALSLFKYYNRLSYELCHHCCLLRTSFSPKVLLSDEDFVIPHTDCYA